MNDTTATADPVRSLGEDQDARDLLAMCLDDWGFHTEAHNVRTGEDLESYETDFRLIQQLRNYGILSYPNETASTALAQQAVADRPVFCASFGFGGVAVSTAKFGDPAVPAVLLREVETVGVIGSPVEAGELRAVLTFPTEDQAQRVFNSFTNAPQPAIPEGVRLLREYRAAPKFSHDHAAIKRTVALEDEIDAFLARHNREGE